jgi:Rv0078B-related antitoxin
LRESGNYFYIMGNNNRLNNRLNPKQIECMDDEMVTIYKQKSPMERIKIGSDMYDSAWLQINAVLRSMHPDWSDEAINKEIIKRLSHNENL